MPKGRWIVASAWYLNSERHCKCFVLLSVNCTLTILATCFHKKCKMEFLLCERQRATEEDNSTFINMMERYFEQSDFTTDARPHYSYQIGVTPELKERPRNHCERISKLEPNEQPVTLCPPQLDKKSRFYWRIGERPKVMHIVFRNLIGRDKSPTHPTLCCIHSD